MGMRQLKISKSITNRESQSLEKYLQEIGKVSLATPEDEVLLANKIRQGDTKALDKLVIANLRFVVSVAKQYQNQGLTLSDLINEGNLGLIKAAQRFDETRGWIRQSILQALAEQSRIVRLPLNKVGLTSKITKAFSQLEQEFEREPTIEELATLLDVDKGEISAALSVSICHVSMDAPMAEGEENTLIDTLYNPNAESANRSLEHHESLHTEINRSLSILSDRQKDVVCSFYGIGTDTPLSLEDIGQRFHLTRERVRQIKDKALLKLKTGSRCNLLRPYLGA